jgi:hypothetical protein
MPAMRRRRRPRQIRAPERWTRKGPGPLGMAVGQAAPMVVGFGRAPRRRWPAKGEAAQDTPTFFPGKSSILPPPRVAPGSTQRPSWGYYY